ncbi:hypothetical protein BJS_01888 [Bradyrhizobium japonicum SEMIA 5079]|nr:hypothetical protein BJS_01888 [Bradyrhizobium japonicum SEMIA 5079]
MLHERFPGPSCIRSLASESCIGRSRGHLAWLDAQPNRLRGGRHEQTARPADTGRDQGEAGSRRRAGGGPERDLPGVRSRQRHPAGAEPPGRPCEAFRLGAGSTPFRPVGRKYSANNKLPRRLGPCPVMINHIF